MNTHTALSVVLNQSSNELIDGINKRNKIEKIVDDIIDEFIGFINDYNFYNNSKYEIVVWRQLLEIKHHDKLKIFINRYDDLHHKFANLNKHFIKDIDGYDDTTPLIQATNAGYLLNYKKYVIETLTKNINKKRKTKCCGKILNESSKEHKHYSFYNMIQDRNNDLAENACKICRPVWCYDNLYNCEICNLKWNLFNKCFYQYICRTSDVLAPKENNCMCFYNDYTAEEKDNCGLTDIPQSLTYLKTNYDAQTDVLEEDEVFDYYLDITEDELDGDIFVNVSDVVE